MSIRERRLAAPRRDRLSAHHQGRVRRRRTRHARGRNAGRIRGLLEEARGEARAAFGNGAVFLERYIRAREAHRSADPRRPPRQYRASHERDCSVQRRHQKVVEVAPAVESRPMRCASALAKPPSARRAKPATTTPARSSFWSMPTRGELFFIEVNPRIQVEHTVTEMVTGIDIVRSQILIAQGHTLHGPEIDLPQQERDSAVRLRAAVPRHHRRSGEQIHAGLRQDPDLPLAGGIRRPAGRRLGLRRRGHHAVLRFAAGEDHAPGAAISTGLPAHGSRAARVPHPRREDEHSVPRKRGQQPEFRAGDVTTRFSMRRRSCSQFTPRDRATKLLTYLGEVDRQRQPGGRGQAEARANLGAAPVPRARSVGSRRPARGSCSTNSGPEKFAEWTLRRSGCCSPTRHFAMRISRCWRRACAPTTCSRSRTSWRTGCRICSAWRCGAARPSTSRCAFCCEDPWQRLRRLREAIPNICFQMLLRASNAVGYTAYPDNVVAEFIYEAARAGHRYLPHLRFAELAAEHEGRDGGGAQDRHGSAKPRSATPATSSIPARTNIRLSITSAWRRSWRRWARTSWRSRTWPGLCKPVRRREAGAGRCARRSDSDPLPYARHERHQCGLDPEGGEAGVDVADGAIASMSGTTSQPNLNSIVAALEHTPRDTGLDLDALNECADYWEDVRSYYAPFDTGPQVRHRRSLSARDAGRPVHESERAGRVDGPGRSGGPRSRARTPTSTWRSATSSR